MIPAKLTMKNFLCYRDNVPPLNFEGMHVACLCGDNGSGKSSIFDAIAWALWGEASRGKSNDDLIFIGQNEMEVELEFLAGNELYRVVRKHTRSTTSKSGQSLLELQIFNSTAFKSISEHTKTQTQDKILGLLHLDYQTFINSAMILQGRANEFSNKRPGERKEILASILDLSFYDQLEQQAKLNADNLGSELTILEREVQQLTAKLEMKLGLEEASRKIIAELGVAEQARTKIIDELAVLRKKREALSSHKESLDLLTKQLKAKENELQLWTKRIAESTGAIERFSKILPRAPEIESGYADFKNVSAQEEALNEKLKKSLELVRRRSSLEAIISSALNAFSSQRKELSSRVTELTTKAARLPQLQDQLSKLATRQAGVQKEEEDIEAQRRLVNEVTGLLSKVSTLDSELHTAIEEIKRKLGMISEAAATCPLCEQELGPGGRTRIEGKLTLELQQKIAQSKENITAMTTYKSRLGELEKEAKRREVAAKSERDSVKQQIAIAEKEVHESQAAAGELAVKNVALQTLEADIRHKSYAPEEQRALAAVIQEQNVLNYDSTSHKFISDRRASLLKFEQLHKDLSDARLQLEPQHKVKSDAETTATQVQNNINEYAQRCLLIGKEIAELPALARNLETLEQQQNVFAADERQIRDRLAETRESLRQLSVMASEKQEKDARLAKCKEEESIYMELAHDFSKKGIQALIIEESLPEIADEANLLLGKMTDNRMSLSLDTQRGTKKGEMIETLDIKISDELGTRSYDMYSGGEAFRIDLALRIAISRLLVRRAGASMPVLIIDEGFGTQDSSGLEKLVEAISAIQDDFEKLFVITHLDELKDRFPVLINITKTPQGSTISISE